MRRGGRAALRGGGEGGVSVGAREPARRMSPSHSSSSSACPFAAQPSAGKGRRRCRRLAAWGAAGCASPPCSPWAPAPAWSTTVGKEGKEGRGPGSPPRRGSRSPHARQRGEGGGGGGWLRPGGASRHGGGGKRGSLLLAPRPERFVSFSASSFPWLVSSREA